jgi:restriction system protein
MGAFGADYALFVSWSGFSTHALAMAKTKWFQLRLWTADDLVEQATSIYDDLPDDIRAKLPLRRVWISAAEPDSG